MSSESLITSTSVPPSARARASPRRTPRYSATLLVAAPITSAASSSTSPSGVETTAPTAAGPGLPRAPPSTWTRSLTELHRREVPRDARAAAIAGRAAGGFGLAHTTIAPLPLAPVDDDRHVRVVGVVGDELVVELVGELLGKHAVDHAGERLSV